MDGPHASFPSSHEALGYGAAQSFSLSLPLRESFMDAEARLLDEIERIVARHPRGRVVIGTHGDLVGMLVSHFAGAHLDQFQRVTVDPASVSVVHLGDVPASSS